MSHLWLGIDRSRLVPLSQLLENQLRADAHIFY